MNKIFYFLSKYKTESVLVIFAVIFSFWLMFSTFSYKEGTMLIASKAWSDFGSHIPLIRSFSFGSNFPPEYPLFSGTPIKYHFLFYALVGLFEKLGLQIDAALNIPSALGFIFLILLIYYIAKNFFKSKAVGILSVVFFLFNGSLSFLNFFTKHPFSKNSFNEIVKNTSFPSFGPYDHTSIVSAFWNLNIYTNQRHLALSYALSLFAIYLFLNFENLSNKRGAILLSVFTGILLGIFFILNMAVFLMTAIVIAVFFIFMRKERIYIFITLALSGIIAFPLFKYITSVPSTFQMSFHPGYLIENLNLINFLNYWFQNLGLHFALIPIGFLLATRFNKKILFSFFLLFILGNLVQFSPEIAANHKFFNYFLIVGSMFSAYGLVELWKKKNILKPVVIVLFFFLILSGLIDFFPILNDNKIALADYSKNPDIAWIKNNTPPNSIFLNTDFFMDNASIAGRKIFLGWPYFAWSQGYDTNTRDNLRKNLLNSVDLKLFCRNTTKYNLSFLEINIKNKYDNTINYDFFNQNLKSMYKNQENGFQIFNISKSCT